MRTKVLLSVFCMVALAAVASLEAQERGQRGGRGGGMGFGGVSRGALLRVEAVQEELEVSEEQKEKLGELRGGGRQRGEGADREGGRERGGDAQGGRERGGDAEGGRRQGRGGGARSPEQVEEEIKAISEILNDDQVERLNQIFVQVAGIGAIQDPIVGKQLDISEDQVAAIREIQGSMRERMQDIFSSGGGDREAMMEAFQEVRAEIESEIMDELTKEQKEKLDDMKGEKFEMPEGALRGGRGGGRGGRTDF